MSMAERAVCDSKEMGEQLTGKTVDERKLSSEGRDDDLEDDDKLDLGPRLTLKHQLEMDKV